MEMHPKDEKILQYIRKNARMNLTTISRKTGIPVSTIFDRLRSHEGKLITKFTALLDFAQLGYMVKVKLFVKAMPEHRLGVRNYLLGHARVNNLYRINNGYDYSADCVFRSLKEAEEFMDDLESKFTLQQRLVFHVIDDLAREKMLAEELVVDV